MAVGQGGREAVTHYRVAQRFAQHTLLRVMLETGRTHQIRVHFSALRHPCAGDLTYGADPRLAATLGLTRQWLHARQLGFDDVPLICARELEIDGSMPRVVRMMAHVETELSRKDVTHVYLHGAANLRRDLTRTTSHD